MREIPKSDTHSKRSLVKWSVGLIATVFILLFAGIAVLLFGMVKIQQNLFSKTPTYTAQDLYDRANQQVDSGDYSTAEGYLQQALQKQDDATYRNQLAVVEYRLKKYPEAIAQYQALIIQKQDVAFAYNGMGNAYRDWALSDKGSSGEHNAKAEESYRSSIQTDDTYVAAYSNLAQLLSSEGKTAEALQVLDQGITKSKSPELATLKVTLSE